MTETRWVVFDVEADSLTPTKIYCLSFHDHLGNKGTYTEYEDLRAFFRTYDVYVGHNIRRWDLPELVRLTGIDIPGRVVDTLGVSWYLYPGRGSHGLEDWGTDLGVAKPPILDWETLSLATYIHRCETDVEINVRLWKQMLRDLYAVYEDWENLWSFLGYLDFKLVSAQLQEVSGFRLDRERCEGAVERLQLIKDEKVEALREAMPKVPVVVKRSKPKVLHKKDGSLSVAGEKWLRLLWDRDLPNDYEGEVEEITGYEEANPNSSDQKKAWLYSLGWVPETIKYQRNKTTGEMKEIPQITKEKQKGGGACESVKKLYEKEANLELLDGLGILSHRIGILNGLLRDVDDDGFVHARIAGLTNTLRFKHAELVNLPKLENQYAEDIRGSLVSPDDDHELCGSDMAGVEDRIKQHYLFDFDPDYVRSLQSDDYDPHIDIAVLAGLMTEDEGIAYKNGDHSKKPVRSVAKNGNYACQYGARVPRLMITCGIDRPAAQGLFDAYWERNWAIQAVADAQTTKEVDGQLWLYNPVSGFWYSLRAQKDVFSTLVQGTAAFVFDLWLRQVYQRRPEFTGQFHDEVILTIKKGHREACTNLLKEAISEVNSMLGLNVPLDIDVQYGTNYGEIH